MGVAEEFEEGEEGSIEEHNKRLTGCEKQVEVLKAALQAEKKKSATGAFCQMERCIRPIDIWCGRCERSLCSVCSELGKCGDLDPHSSENFNLVYEDVQSRFVSWREYQTEQVTRIDDCQKKMISTIEIMKRKEFEASAVSLRDRAARVIEIAGLMEKLGQLTIRVAELKTNITKQGEAVDKLSKPKRLCVGKKVVGRIPAQPCSLQFITKYNTKSKCISVHHHSKTADVLVGYVVGLQLISRQSGKVTQLSNYHYPAVAEHKGKVYISSSHEGTVSVYRFNIDDKTNELLFSYSYSSPYRPYMSVSDHHIVCIAEGSKDIKLYNKVSGTVSTVQLLGLSDIDHLQFLPDESLLVVGEGKGRDTLNKYQLSEDGEVTLIWSQHDVRGRGGLSVADSRLSLVCGYNNKTIYIVTSDGEKLGEFTCDELPKFCWDISIRGDELAVASYDRGVFVYKII